MHALTLMKTAFSGRLTTWFAPSEETEAEVPSSSQSSQLRSFLEEAKEQQMIMNKNIIFNRSIPFGRWIFYYAKSWPYMLRMGETAQGFCVMDDYGNTQDVPIMLSMFSLSLYHTQKVDGRGQGSINSKFMLQ